LNKYPPTKPIKISGGKKKYGDPELIEIFKYIWESTSLLCSKRLKASLTGWLPSYEKHYG
jgi:hypothetical protein